MQILSDFFARWFSRESESGLWDERVTSVLTAHPRIFEITCEAFEVTRRRGLECGLFWYGTKSPTGGVNVAAVVVPEQHNQPGNYYVDGEAIEEMSARTRASGWFNLAQVHTHPSAWVGHSAYDNQRVNSRNALSLVLPHYGKSVPDWTRQIGIHEFLNGEWRRLAPRRSRERIKLNPKSPVPQLIDLRTS